MRAVPRTIARLIVAVGLLLVASPPIAAAALPLPAHAGSVVSTPIAVSPGKPTTALSTTFTTTEPTSIRVTGWLSITNNGKKAAEILLRYTMVENGVPEIIGPDVPVTVPAKSSVAIPAGFQCDGAEPAGTYTVTADVIATAGVVVDDGAQTALALPVSYPGYLPTADVTGDGKVALGTTDQTLLQTTLSWGDGSALNAMAEGWVSIRNDGRKATTVTLDYSMDGVQMGTVTSIIGPDRSFAMPLGFICDGAKPGDHVFKVSARATAPGTTFQAGFVSVVGLPTDGSIPNTHVTGDGKVLSLGSKATLLLSTSLTTQVDSETWMGGWLTIDNPSSKPAAVSLQAAMGGEAEGPPVKATVPAHGSISVPFGLLCDLIEPAGTGTLEVYATGAGGGPQWDGDGIVMGWAIGAP